MADRQLLLFKKEVTYGVDPVAVPANTLWAEAVRFMAKGTDVASDPAKPGVGATPSYTYGEHVEITFDVPFAASGAAGVAPKWGPLVLAAGWSEDVEVAASVTYALRDDPSASDSATLVWRDAKRQHKVVGARGRVSVKASSGGRPMLSFVFRGLYAPVTAAASPVAADADFTGWNDVRPIAQGQTTFSFGGQAMPLREFTVDAGDNIKFVDLPHQENVQLLGERAFTGKLKATTLPIATFNPETAWISRDYQVFTLVHGLTAGSIVTISGQAQVGEPSYTRDQGEDVFEQSLKLLGSNLAASDDLVIVLT